MVAAVVRLSSSTLTESAMYRLNRDGTVMAISARMVMVASISTSRRSNICLPFLRPPKSMAKPSTRRRFPRIEPVSEAKTSWIWPARMAERVIISSAAFPKVALRSPPMRGPDLSAKTSVASPSSFARGIMARAEVAKMAIPLIPAR